MKNELNWDAVKAAGFRLGLKERTVENWYERRAVPFKWWVPIMRVAHGTVTLEALENHRPVHRPPRYKNVSP
jgi:hypothetical protein